MNIDRLATSVVATVMLGIILASLAIWLIGWLLS